MTETTQTPAQTVPASAENDPQPTRLQTFVARHSRVAKVAAFIGVVLGLIGFATVTKNLRSSQRELHSASENAKQELRNLESATTPTPSDA